MALKIILWLVGGFVAFLVIGNVSYKQTKNDPTVRDRQVIDLCWSDQAKKSNTPDVARFMASVCEKKEADFLRVHGYLP